MYVILIGNYPFDGQESMLRFAELLEKGLMQHGISCELLQPKVVINKVSFKWLRKWLGYVDKYALFPLYLKRRLRELENKEDVVVHICDHSNAVYLKHIHNVKTLITCHDLLAVKAALGIAREHAPGGLGKLLQKWILKSIRKAPYVVCDSQKTQEDVQALAGKPKSSVSVIYPGFHYPYKQVDLGIARDALKQRIPEWVESPFILHVGSNAWYKNRLGVLALYKYLLAGEGSIPDLKLIFVGAPLSEQMHHFAHKWGIWKSVYALQGLSNEELQGLYSASEALFMPSFYEGYGWPIIEAMACECPVVTTGEKPMSELGGEVACYIPKLEGLDEKNLLNWAQEASCKIKTFINLDTDKKELLGKRGLEYIKLFDTKHALEKYIQTYRQLV